MSEDRIKSRFDIEMGLLIEFDGTSLINRDFLEGRMLVIRAPCKSTDGFGDVELFALDRGTIHVMTSDLTGVRIISRSKCS